MSCSGYRFLNTGVDGIAPGWKERSLCAGLYNAFVYLGVLCCFGGVRAFSWRNDAPGPDKRVRSAGTDKKSS